ncbi:OmpA family protein [Burkholderia pyrrocinia]|uniref:OmpA family protein n=1 Tax=Burkholderia pyrrocinia TaxID=60550 RepID=UPI00158A0F4F|nr:OmpA family protein [Burkholderia pyrrocinia]
MKSTHWKEHECDAWVVQASAAPAVAAPTASEHFAVNEDVLFAFDRSSLNDLLPGGRTALDDIAERLSDGYWSLKSVTIIGHADRIGPDAHNEELSLARAQTVRDYLVAKGLPRNLVVVAGAGSTTPVTNCPAGKTVEAIRCLQPDRRVTVDVAGEKRD